MNTSVLVAGLVIFNLLLLMLAYLAFRLINSGDADRRYRRRRGASAEDLFSFDSWSGQSTARPAGQQTHKRID